MYNWVVYGDFSQDDCCISRAETWKDYDWPKRLSQLIPCKGRHSTSLFLFLSVFFFVEERMKSVLFCVVWTSFDVSVPCFTFRTGLLNDLLKRIGLRSICFPFVLWELFEWFWRLWKCFSRKRDEEVERLQRVDFMSGILSEEVNRFKKDHGIPDDDKPAKFKGSTGSRNRFKHKLDKKRVQTGS